MNGAAATANLLRFSSKEFHANSGTYYYGFRFYEPNLQRWLNRDLVGEFGGVNLYGFVGNRPIETVDPFGLAEYPSGPTYDFDFADAFIDPGGSMDISVPPPPPPIYIPVESLSQGGRLDPRFKMDAGAIGAPHLLNYPLGQQVVGLNQDIVSSVLPVPFIKCAPAAKSGGRLGSELTRGQIADIAAEMEARGWQITGGGGKLPEEYLRGPNGRLGSSYPDITATKNGRTLRVNTVDTYVDGVTPTTREAINAARIRNQTPGDHLLLVPKP